ncbi:MAG: hypothetical protein RLZZ385_1845 [Pseudomonadota bacterium]|jgi:murein DD-endopeptidase MepM/ murein hydrolase activator NlpD
MNKKNFMELVEIIKQFLHRYYPRDHLVAASVLSFAMLVYLLIPVESSSGSTYSQISIPLPVSETLTFQAQDPDNSQPGIQLDEQVPGIGPDDQAQDLAATSGWREVEVKSGDTLSGIFSKVGLSDRELFHVMNSTNEAKVLNRLYPGYQLAFNISRTGDLEQLQVFMSPLEGYRFTLFDGFYEVEHLQREPEVQQVFKHGTISDSLFLAGQREDIPAVTIMEMANIFGGVIDFILDPRLGDHFSLLFEEKYLDGKLVGTGEIIAAQFTNQGKQFLAVRYENEDGDTGYYNPQGESMRKTFLRTPLDVFRISSNFNLARRHPILNTIRAHKGTDYAAPTGTPVRATSDGTVTWAARNGSFGKLVVLKHSGGFETKYAHLSDYAKGIKTGARVRQGDIIGYVGATGGATGPHLHYEFVVNGVHQNPRTVLDKLPKTVSIAKEELPRFEAQSRELLARFNELETARILTLNQQGAE